MYRGKKAAKRCEKFRSALKQLQNCLGGFNDNGRSYAIVLEGDQETPLPWANVIANSHFGTIVTAAGAGHIAKRIAMPNQMIGYLII